MSKRMQIALDLSPTSEALQQIGEGLRRHNEQYAPTVGDSIFAVSLRMGHIVLWKW